jgi:dTMP kinase
VTPPAGREGPGGDSPPPGRFLVLEGVEGVGKTTQVALLDGWLADRGIPHVVAREPGGTGVGEAIRNVLLHRVELTIPPESELFLMLAARAAFVWEVVRPALARGEWVVADRFEFSTFAYQGVGRGLDLEAVRQANRFATGGLKPDLVVVLDLPASEGAARQGASSGRSADRIEREGVAFLERVREGYRSLAAGDPGAELVAAAGEPGVVHRNVLAILTARFPETLDGRLG